ncbi:3-deoxy-D-manno-octulosonic acid transferase [Roseibacterium sp. SDUM158017]|uniref:3-deoxy-D-manno-octulosonic acid transferase n=1 Tax=Roseicyclus salinarum TaxID=3036773 RepID=UPI0024156660|nr:3-deoxy-D-manno-octulosonic acid transferase [Roseibacterium sp. SDUM158017]MDG4646824.1 3-deoxy-D-manno-octulosonic acid transferase [Roseibacterium sp. SDUM158017]
MGHSIALGLYLAWSGRGGLSYANRKLSQRLEEGKEDASRIAERRGEATLPRPDGRLIWFHAASVGESLALLELIRRILDEREDIHVLVTTGTVTSAGVMAERLPERAFHQYVPLDARAFVTRFLDHWKPDLAIWCESEFWPALICETHARGVPMVIVNARMSKTSHDRWRFLKGMARSLLERFGHAMVQDDITAMYLRRLGMPPERMEVTGTLKEGAAALPCNEDERRELAEHLGGRPVWLAASTHDGEERIVLEAHDLALKVNPRLLLILVPRHPQRGDEIAHMLQAEGWRFNRRTADEMPDADAQVYLADTMGELGLWYRISSISFVGGSLQPIGGHNPFEPAALGSSILHGPYVTNFVDIYQRLTEAKAARLVSGPDTLAEAVHELLNPDRAAAMAHEAWEVVSAGAEVTDRALDMILGTLDTDAAGRRA